MAVDLSERIDRIRPQCPEVGGLEAGRVDEGGGEWRAQAAGVRVPTTRYYAKYPVVGDVELLKYWPDESERPLRSVHHELIQRVGGYAQVRQGAEEDSREYFRLISTWQLHLVDEGGPWALYTFVDMTRDEERAMAAAGGFRGVMEDRFERVAEIVEEICRQTAMFFDAELPELATSLIEARREVLTDREAILRDLEVPDEWAGEPMTLEEDAIVSAVAEPGPGEPDADPVPTPTAVVASERSRSVTCFAPSACGPMPSSSTREDSATLTKTRSATCWRPPSTRPLLRRAARSSPGAARPTSM